MGCYWVEDCGLKCCFGLNRLGRRRLGRFYGIVFCFGFRSGVGKEDVELQGCGSGREFERLACCDRSWRGYGV